MPSVSWSDVAIAWVAMLFPLVLSSRRDPKFARVWLFASARAAGQLALLGLLLNFLFREDDWRWTSLAGFAMLLVAARTALQRSRYAYPHMFRDCVLSLSLALLAALITVSFFTQGKVLVGRSAAFIPLLGILLGNSLSGLSLGLSQWLRELHDRRAELEFWLSIGATRREALAQLKGGALQTAMTTIVNALTVAGVVSIPGMMTGQLLAGGEVGDAVRYQLAIMFLIAMVVYGATALCLKLSENGVFDAWDNLRAGALGEAK